MAEKVVIIGSGPAGWTAAIYAARANLEPLVFAGRPKQVPSLVLPGGQLMLTTEVENFPGFAHGVTGPKLMASLEQQAVRFGTRIMTDDGLNPDVSNPDDGHAYKYHDCTKLDLSSHPFKVYGENGEPVEAHALIIATGATANWIGLPNEQRLARSGGGVSACAVCDGALPAFRNKELAVVGGGDSAVEEATYLTKFGSKVYIIHRRDEFRASKIMAERAINNPKIEVKWNSVVDEVLGTDREGVTGVRIRHTTDSDRTETLEATGYFAAIGHTPNTAFLKGQLKTNDKGYIVWTTPSRTYTTVEGVFAAGDVADDYYRQAITAAGTGCMAALDAERWLAAKGYV